MNEGFGIRGGRGHGKRGQKLLRREVGEEREHCLETAPREEEEARGRN